ncbi:BtpA/SgcQ family protein [Pedosphaera parvula]|uniref:Photosystem I assembly BtpA n=1 Tax=Pedosphaera parvula (strain Ellin514) TaxID=320771 RepID=B9XEW7_PEDPL|nr:BtpA/SgcQ family protein [Pedosphaera parvula]EEF61465.1 photosystem I assembly BtpA [Pedosphaera parvula Ellin514]
MKSRLFASAKPIIGMIHVGALPGTPANHLSLGKITEIAVQEAKIYRDAGVDGIAIENMHDVPYLRGGVGPEIVSSMTIIGQAVKQAFCGVTGIQILAAANREAMAAAHAAALDWVRVEGFVFAHVADEGFINSCAAELLRYRKQIGAEKVQVWADIKKKHSSHAITADISLGETAHAAEFMRADALIVTGPVTGRPPVPADAEETKAHTHLPVILGSGMNEANIGQFLPVADGFIVGSSFKKAGDWNNPVDSRKVKAFMKRVTAR